MSRGKELAKNTIIMLVGKIATQFFSFLLLPLYTHLLPKEDYGVVDLISSYVSIAIPVATLQLEMAAFRFLIDARKKPERQAVIIRTAFNDLFERILIVTVLYLIIVQFVDFNYKYYALFAALSIGLSNVMLQISRGLGKNLVYTVAAMITASVTIVSNLILICVLHMGAQGILISMSIANIVCACFLFIKLEIYSHLKQSGFSKELSKKMVKYSTPLVLNSISWWLISSSDRTIVTAILGAAANGTYAIACKFPSIVSGFIGVFSYSWTESASLHIEDEDKDKYFSSVAGNALRLFSSIGISVIAFLPMVFNIIVGEEYRDSYNYIPIAILAVVLNSIVLVYSAIYVAKKLTKKVAATSIASAIINIIVDLVLIKIIGLYSAVISTAVAYLIMAIYRHIDVRKYVKIKYSAKDLILSVTTIVVVSICYYSGINYLLGVGMAVAVVYVAVQNWGLLKKFLKR